MPLSTEQFATAVTAAGLLSADEIKAIWNAFPASQRPKDGESFANLLVKEEKLTQFQAKEVLSGGKTPLVLGEYVLMAKIGAGGMGQVFKAKHRRMKRLVAVKLLPDSLAKDKATVKRFEREVEAAAKLVHPNIVQAYDAGVQHDVWYLVMEYVEGRDLSSVLAIEGPLPIVRAVDYIRQASRGVAFAHENGVVHRDIKPANLLLDNNGTVKILDMGLARFDDGEAIQEGLTQSGQVMGTIDYMAPEQAFDTRTVDARADIYSLGCTLFRILTGTHLFEGGTLAQKLMAHQQQPVPLLFQRRTDAPRQLDAIFQKMVAKRPEDRYQSMVEVEFALNSLLSASLANSADKRPRAGSKLAACFRYLSGQASQPQRATAGAATLTLANPGSSTADGMAPTVTLANPLQGTVPVSSHSVKIPQDQAPLTYSVRRPLAWRHRLVLLAGSLCGLAMLMAAVVLLFQMTADPNRAKMEDNQREAAIKGTENVPKEVEQLEVEHGDKLIGRSNPLTVWNNWPANAPPPAVAPFDEANAKLHQKAWANYLQIDAKYNNSLGMTFAIVPPGEFMMGSTPAEIDAALKLVGEDEHWQNCIKSEAPQHKVIITKPFYLGIHEVTQAQYEQVMGKNPSHFTAAGPGKESFAGMDTKSHPVEMVSWNDAVEFCRKLSEKEQLKPLYNLAGEAVTSVHGNGYRLPKEAEWEFACRAGTTTKYWIGDKNEELMRAGWFNRNSESRTHAVGELRGNPFGLYDTHGNVMEWVQDWWDPNYYGQFQEQPALDPNGPTGSLHLMRGGRWNNDAICCRGSDRSPGEPSSRGKNIGFRVALVIDVSRVRRP